MEERLAIRNALEGYCEIARKHRSLGVVVPNIGVHLQRDATPDSEGKIAKEYLSSCFEMNVKRQTSDTEPYWLRRLPGERRGAPEPLLFLYGEAFPGINLSGGNLSGATLVGTFDGADITRADLSGSTFPACHFSGANFSNANLSGTHAAGAMFDNADLSGVNMDLAYNIDTSYVGANLTDAIISRATIQDSDFSEANLSGVVLLDTHILDSDLTGVNLSGAVIVDSFLDLSRACSLQDAIIFLPDEPYGEYAHLKIWELSNRTLKERSEKENIITTVEGVMDALKKVTAETPQRRIKQLRTAAQIVLESIENGTYEDAEISHEEIATLLKTTHRLVRSETAVHDKDGFIGR